MSNEMNFYQIIANLVSSKDLSVTFYDVSELLLDDFYDECKESFNNAIDTFPKFMPSISD